VLISATAQLPIAQRLPSRANLLYTGNPDTVKPEQDMSIGGKSCLYSDQFPACSSGSGQHEMDSRFRGRQVMIVGDSHAQRHAPLAKSLARRLGIKVSISAVPAYPFPPNQVIRLKDPQAAKAGYEKQLASMSQSLRLLRRGDVLAIVNSGSYGSGLAEARSNRVPGGFRYPDNNWNGDNQAFFLERLSERLGGIAEGLNQRGVSVIYFLPNPVFQSTEISECFPQWYQALNVNRLCGEEQSMRAVLRRHEKTLFPVLRRLESRGSLLVYNPLNALCGADLCKRIVNGKQAYTDGSHLSIHGSELVSENFAGFLIKSVVLESGRLGD
jgi:hypothetical protein